jgi:ribosomal protein L23
MYIRLKRKNQTVFLHVEPSDNFFQIKQRVAENFNIEPSGIMLFAGDKVMTLSFYVLTCLTSL